MEQTFGLGTDWCWGQGFVEEWKEEDVVEAGMMELVETAGEVVLFGSFSSE